MYEYNAIVNEIYDANSITVTVELGFDVYTIINLKLSGICAPAIYGEDKPYGLASRNKLRELILNKHVIVKSFKTTKNGKHTYSADVFYNNEVSGLMCVNDWLVENKLAIYKEY